MANKCKACGAEILWGKTIEGKKIPLDKRAPIYEFNRYLPEDFIIKVENAFVSHFCTCPKASEFSKRKKQNQQSLKGIT